MSKINNFLIQKAIAKNKRIFGKKPGKIKVIICDSEEEFKKASKYYYVPKMAATVLRDGTIIIKSRKLLNSKNGDYQGIVTHEMAHVFWGEIYGEQKPIWISEGIAVLIGEGLNCKKFHTLKNTKKWIKYKKWDEKCLKYRYLAKDFKDVREVVILYSIWAHFLNFISKKKISNITSFVNDYFKKPTKTNYHKLFRKHFKDSIKNKFQEFMIK